MLIDMNRHGFTIIELIITITVMGILLILGVANLRSSQIPARDSTRKTDIDSIAQSLEIYYRTGTDGTTTLGRYPSTVIIGQETVMLRDIDPKVLSAPGVTGSSLVAATNNTQTTTGIAPSPLTTSTYIYQPLQADGSLCTLGTQECRKFNLYYMLEADGLVYIVTSKNQ